MRKIPTLSDKFSQLGAQARGEAEVKPYGFLATPAKDIPLGEAPIPLVQRRAEYLEGQLKHTAQEGKGKPRKCLLSTYRGHTNVVTCCAVRLLGAQEYLFTGSLDSTVRAFHLVTGTCIMIYEGHSAGISCLDIHDIVGTASQSVESRVRHETLDPIWEDTEHDIFSFKLSSIEKLITIKVFSKAAAGHDDVIGMVQLRFKEDILKGQENKDPQVAGWHALKIRNSNEDRGKILLEFRWMHVEKKLSIFLQRGKKFPKIKHKNKADPYVVITIKDQPVMRLFTASDDSTARMWDINTGKVLKSYVGHGRQVSSVAVATIRGSQKVFTGSLDKTVKMWDALTGDVIRTFEHPSAVNCICIQHLFDEMQQDVTEEMIRSPPEIRLRIEYIFDVKEQRKAIEVMVQQGRNLPVMDTLGLCDPYVQVSLGGVTKTTKVLKRTLQPMWNETFEFDTFTMDMDVLVKVFDWDRVGGDKYIGHVATLLEPLQIQKRVHEWFPLDAEANSRTRLFSGCMDKKARMFDVRVGKELRTFSAHLGAVTDIKMCDVNGKPQLFTASEDGMVKLWDLTNNQPKLEHSSRSWPHEAAVAGCMPIIIYDQLRIFAACKDAVAYMWTLPKQGIVIDQGWRQKLAKFIDSIAVSVFILLCIIIDVVSGFSFEYAIKSEDKDCFARDPIASTAITGFVLIVFSVELTCQIIAHGKAFFWPISKMNYFDLTIVIASIAVFLFQIATDYSQDVRDPATGEFLPPTVKAKDYPEVCTETISGNAGQSAGSNAVKGLRVARIGSRIALAIRILRAVIKTARIALKLGGTQGKKFQGHEKFLTALTVLPPLVRDRRGWFGVIKGEVDEDDGGVHAEGGPLKESKKLEEWRTMVESKWRIITASGDNRVMMWDILGTEIRVDRDHTFEDKPPTTIV